MQAFTPTLAMSHDDFFSHAPTDQNNQKNCYKLYGDGADHVRNIMFIMADGAQFFHNYYYLKSGECLANQKLMSLQFASHSVRVNGERPLPLFKAIMLHKVEEVCEVKPDEAERYDKEKPLIYSFEIQP